MVWRVAGGVLAWHRDLQAGYPAAAPPATPKVAWGTVADAAHTSTSDHAPKDFPGWGQDIVTAGDAPHRPELGLDMATVTEAMRKARDVRVKYVIFNRRIFSSYSTPARSAWTWGPYSNASTDPHTDHAHLSVVGDPRADGTQPWEVGVSLTPEQAQQLANVHAITIKMANGESGNLHPHVPNSPVNAWLRSAADGVDHLVDNPVQPAPVDVAALAEALRPIVAEEAERAVRKVLGTLDGATPASP